MPKPRQLPNRDAFTRMNFLYQAAHFSMALNKGNTDVDLARFYVTSMKTIAKRLVLRAGSSVKQTICKKCNTLLIPGQSCRTRVYGNRQTHLVVTCTSCGTFKRYPLRPDYKLHRKAVISDVIMQPPSEQEQKQTTEHGAPQSIGVAQSESPHGVVGTVDTAGQYIDEISSDAAAKYT